MGKGIVIVIRELIGKRFGIIQKVILVLAVFAMSVVWPLGTFKVTHVSEGTWDGMRMSGASNETDFVRQEFAPNFEALEAVSVYVCNDAESFDTMQVVFRLYDYTGRCLSEKFLQLEEYETPGYVRIPLNVKVSPEILYFYTIGGVDDDLVVAYCNDDAKTAENGALFYKEVPAGGTSVVTGYEYTRPLGLKRILLCDGMIACVAAALILGVGLLRRKVLGEERSAQKEAVWRKAERIVQYGITGVTACVVLLAFYGIVIRRLFTDDVLNIVVLFAGVLIAVAWLLFEVFHCKSELEPLLPDEQDVVTKGIHLIRSLLLAVTILMCCMYQNGGSDYEKGLYIRRMLTFFAFFMVSSGKKKQIFNLPVILWTPAAWLFGKYYISLHSDHIEHIQTATGNAWVIWAVGLLLIHLIYRIKDGDFKRFRQMSVPFATLIFGFWILCIVFSNGRAWPAILCVIFTLWSLFYITCEYREELLEDICNGILWSFAGAVVFCLYRRPYQYFMLTRYAGIFFTVTVTATYYLLPVAAILTKILLAEKEKNQKKLISAWLVYGTIAGYMSFTASRTGIVAMVVMTLAAILIPHKEAAKKVILCKLKSIGMMVVSVILMFVMTFSATRMVPAMAANPFYFPWERPNAYMDAQTPWKGGEGPSERYIDIQKTIQMLFEKVFAVSEEEQGETAFLSEWQEGPLLVSSKEDSIALPKDGVGTYANGRLEIFQAYFSQLNLTGHETMSAIAEDGTELVHAHNSYLQVAFDFGIPTGIFFLIICLMVFVKSVVYGVRRRKEDIRYEVLPLFMITGFGVASIFEWVYHPANALGFLFLLMFAPLMLKRNKKCKNQE